ncbi:putative carboxylesterase 18 [Platanthera zijinensis]|uniref:Carboxylesterase 18 n=1 Tax=Platanthera zijinensis TaxID=2320716 RepID=A0AAP0GF17_9ASPA
MPSGDLPTISIPTMTRLKAAVITAVTRSTRRRDGTINRTLLAALDWKAKPSPKPIKGISTSDHTVDASRGLWVRFFSPAAVQPDTAIPIIVYFHGGGFAYHSASTLAYDALCRRIAGSAHARVVSVEYRLAPEHRFPAAYDDGFDALRWIDDADVRFSSVFLAGDSAGGNIAHHVARRAVAEKETLRRVRVNGVVEIQPFFGGEEATASELRLDGRVPFGSRESYEWLWRTFLPAGSSLDGKWSNVFGPGSDSGRRTGPIFRRRW